MRYIIALLAAIPDLYIREAQKFKAISESYILSDNSLPHITITQFNLESDELLQKIWNKLKPEINSMPSPRFIGFGLTRKLNKFWNVSLTVARDPELVELQSKVLLILDSHNIKSV